MSPHVSTPFAAGVTPAPSLPALVGHGPGARAYARAVRDTWRHARDAPEDEAAVARELVRYATLAPSSHNTQCWRFHAEPGAITISPDFGRRCPEVDPDDHHLFASLGCAAETLAIAAPAFGLAPTVSFDGESVRVALTPGATERSVLFEAIPHRQSTRTNYDGRPLAESALDRLVDAGTGDGVAVRLVTDPAEMERVRALIVQSNTAQLGDPLFRNELNAWVRFNAHDALRSGDGLYGASSGHPSLPRWLGNALFGRIVAPDAEADRITGWVRSSAGLAVIVSDTDDPAHWVAAGRALQRLLLQATALGVRTAMLNQPVEVPETRSQLVSDLGLSGRPDFVVRFGHGPRMPCSLRRPLDAVLDGPLFA